MLWLYMYMMVNKSMLRNIIVTSDIWYMMLSVHSNHQGASQWEVTSLYPPYHRYGTWMFPVRQWHHCSMVYSSKWYESLLSVKYSAHFHPSVTGFRLCHTVTLICWLLWPWIITCVHITLWLRIFVVFVVGRDTNPPPPPPPLPPPHSICLHHRMELRLWWIWTQIVYNLM